MWLELYVYKQTNILIGSKYLNLDPPPNPRRPSPKKRKGFKHFRIIVSNKPHLFNYKKEIYVAI